MRLSNLAISAGAAALCGAVAFAQTSKPATQPAAAAIVHAHADIKGEGITGTADFTERAMGTGKIVDITVTAAGLKPGMTIPYPPAARAADTFIHNHAVQRIWERDISVWRAEPGSADARSIQTRLGWLDVAHTIQPELGRIAALADAVKTEGIRNESMFN